MGQYIVRRLLLLPVTALGVSVLVFMVLHLVPGNPAQVIAGGSPFDLVEPPDRSSYSAFDTYERCPRQSALLYICRRPADQPSQTRDSGAAAQAASVALTQGRRARRRGARG